MLAALCRNALGQAGRATRPGPPAADVEKHTWARVAPELVVTISFGISDPTAGGDAREPQSTADRHLYIAENSDRNRVEPRRH